MSNTNTDPMLMFKSCKVGENKKGNMYMTLNLAPAEVEALIEQAEKLTNERGLQIQIHTSDRESKSGTKFLGAVGFIRGVPEPPEAKVSAPADRSPRPSRLAGLRKGRPET